MLKSVIVAIGLLGLADLAQAQTPPRPTTGLTVGRVLEACQADLTRFCADQPFRSGAVGRCLRKNREEASATCQAFLDEQRSRAQGLRERLRPSRTAVREACAADYTSFCGEARRSGRLLGCIRENREKFSAGCKTAQAALQRLRSELREGAQMGERRAN